MPTGLRPNPTRRVVVTSGVDARVEASSPTAAATAMARGGGHDPLIGPQDTTQRDCSGTGIDQRAGHEPDHSCAQEGHDKGGNAGHGPMMMICGVPMLVIGIALVASGTAGVGTIVLMIGCALVMALMMGGPTMAAETASDSDA